MIVVGGNGFDAVARWRKLFDEGDKAVRLASRAMAEEMLGLTLDRFRTETDPYGRRWKRKQRPDGRKVLSGKTSRLKNGWHIVRADHGGWMIAPSVDYAAAHQKPGVKTVRVRPTRRVQGRTVSSIAAVLGITLTEDRLKRPRRMMVPDGARGLPRSYASALEESAQEALTLHFAGGGSLIPISLGGGRFSIRDFVRRVVRMSQAANE